MNAIPGKEILDEVALELGINGGFVEKDWYVTQIIQIIASFSYEGFQMVFSGGTALSKAHKLLQRFSEDVDFRIIAPHGLTDSRSKQKQRLSTLKNTLFDLLIKELSLPAKRTFARNENRFFAIEFDYPTVYPKEQALRSHVLIEFTMSSLNIPAINCSVSSLINELSSKTPEVSKIACLDPVENAVDKLSALVWRVADRVRGSETDDPTIVRHLHDLAILKDFAVKHQDFARLAKKTIEQDDARSERIAGFSLERKFSNLLHILAEDNAYKGEYETFVRGMSYAKTENMPSFTEAVAGVKSLIHNVLSSVNA